MSLLNTEELKRQIAAGTFTGLDDITSEFKNILKEVIQAPIQTITAIFTPKLCCHFLYNCFHKHLKWGFKSYIQLISATHLHKIMPPFSLIFHS